MDLEQVGRRIAEQRRFVKRVSQEKMADDLEMYQADVSSLEHAKKGSGISDLNKLQTVADYLQISLEELLFGSGKGTRMQKYNKKMEIKWAGQKAKFTETNRKMLASYYGIAPEQVQPLIYYCDKYVIYALKENVLSPVGPNQTFGFSKIHLMVTFENAIIGTADVDNLPLMFFIHQPSFIRLQTMIDHDILDVSDVLRTLNPYIPLAQFTKDPEKRQAYQDKVYARMDELMALKDQEGVLLIENLYVIEECRNKGICHMLLDMIHQLFQTGTIWLNLEPLNYEYLLYGEMGSCIPPVYSREDIRKISQNSGIAEMLGFTVDPDGWYRQISDLTDPDAAIIRNLRIRKTAFKLSPALSQVIENDGELVRRGWAMQVMEQTSEDEESSCSLTFRYRKQNGEILVELPTDSGTSLMGLFTKDNEIRLAASETGILGKDKVSPEDFHWISPDDIEGGCPEPMEMILCHLYDQMA